MQINSVIKTLKSFEMDDILVLENVFHFLRIVYNRIRQKSDIFRHDIAKQKP